MDADEEISGQLVVTGGNRAKMLEFIEEALDEIALTVIRAAGSESASNGSAQIRSLVCPGESINSTGLPNASTSAWILVLSPPRDRPIGMAMGSGEPVPSRNNHCLSSAGALLGCLRTWTSCSKL